MFPLYRNDTMCLVVSGIGKTLAAAATAYLHETCGALPYQAFLNVGIAGHYQSITGTALIANRIIEGATGHTWYPGQVTADSIGRTSLITVDIVEHGYLHDAAYDMEAAGFYPIACRASTTELVQSLKVISDCPGKPVASLNTHRIECLIGERIIDIDRFIRALEKIAQTAARMTLRPIKLNPFTGRWHFSVTQQHRLRRILKRWAVLIDGEDPVEAVPNDCLDGEHAIKALETVLDAMPLDLHADKTR